MSSPFNPGRVPQLIFMITFFIITIVSVSLARRGKLWEVRRIAGIDAIEDAMGRATEMNRPVSYFPGEGRLFDVEGSQTVASLAILSHVARLAARFNTPFFVEISVPESVPAVMEVCRNAFVLEGKEDKWNPTYSIRFAGTGMSAYIYMVALFKLENIAANLMFGSMGIESLPMAEESNRMGALGIAGTARISNASFLLASCDYVVLSDEFYAGAAYLSKDPMQISTINTTDVFKVVSVVLALIGPVLYLIGINLSKILLP